MPILSEREIKRINEIAGIVKEVFKEKRISEYRLIKFRWDQPEVMVIWREPDGIYRNIVIDYIEDEDSIKIQANWWIDEEHIQQSTFQKTIGRKFIYEDKGKLRYEEFDSKEGFKRELRPKLENIISERKTRAEIGEQKEHIINLTYPYSPEQKSKPERRG